LAGHLVGAVHDYALTRGAGRAGGALRAASQGKNPPNPWGRRGGPAHQQKVQERAKQLQDEGYTIVAGGGKKEEAVETRRDPNNPRRRYPDITAEKNGQRHYENVGRRNLRGDPVKREREALEDLKHAIPPGSVRFTPYN
jgi:hypothetical protein